MEPMIGIANSLGSAESDAEILQNANRPTSTKERLENAKARLARQLADVEMALAWIARNGIDDGIIQTIRRH